MKYAYQILDGKYVQELDLNDADTAPNGWYVSATWIDCTQFKPDSNGNPVPIVKPTPILCCSNNGLSYREVDSTYVAQTGEVLFSATPTAEQLAAAFSGYVAEIKKQKITVINMNYQPQFEALKSQKQAAEMLGNPTDAIKVQYKTLFQQYIAEKGAVNNG